jgi:hypothetical protein
MKKQVLRWMMLGCFLPGLLTGCIKDRLLFVTKSTVGIDVDSQPPTSEIAINRKEGVIEPVFEGGQTPPVIASFKADANPVARFFGFGIGSTFATGDAAEALSALFSTTDAEFDTEAKKYTDCETPCTLPWQRKHLLASVFGSHVILIKSPEGKFIKPGDKVSNSDYLFFATDTVLGLKIDWSATVPTGVKVGFNRKEVAWAPLALCETPANNSAQCFPNVSSDIAEKYQLMIQKHTVDAGLKETSTSYIIKAPAVFASLDATYAVGKNSGLAYQQYFATGRAAVNLVAREQVRRTLAPEFDKTASDTQRALAEQVETDYVANGALLQKKLQSNTTTGPTLDRVQTFAEAWKFITPVTSYTPGQTADPGLTNNRTALVAAVKTKMDKTAACFQDPTRSSAACADTSAMTAVSAQDLKTLRDLLRLSE